MRTGGRKFLSRLTNEALAVGKPLIVVPIGGKQGDNAQRVGYLGAGLRVDVSLLTAQLIRTVSHTCKTFKTDVYFSQS